MGVVSFRRDARISPVHREELQWFASGAGRQVEALANRLGVKVVLEDLPYNVSAVLKRAPRGGGPSGFKIAVSRSLAVEHQRMCIAHELGHFVLHRNEPDFCPVEEDEDLNVVMPILGGGNSFISSLNARGVKRLEWEANQFAYALLMPVPLVKASVNFRMNCVSNLAKEFVVPKAVARNRMAEVRAYLASTNSVMRNNIKAA